METIAIIADDLTGASDTAIQFRKYGLKTMVIVDYQDLEGASRGIPVWSINADTRPLTAAEAYERIYAITQKLKDMKFNRLYKKIDSTLRGHPGAELEAVMDALKAELALVVPAFPANGRAVVNGCLVVHPSKNAGGGEELFPTGALEGDLVHVPTLLQKEMRRRVGGVALDKVRAGEAELIHAIKALREQGQEVLVIDAVTEEDMEEIAAACSALPMKVTLAGAAGLASHLPAAWRLNLGDNEKVAKKEGALLVVAGSRNPVSAAQVEELLKATGAPLVEVDTENIKGGLGKQEVERAVKEATRWLGEPQPCSLLVVAVDSLIRRETPETGLAEEGVKYGKTIAEALGEMVRRLVGLGSVRGLVVTGGDVAVHICRALGVKGIELIAELLPGIPLGKCLGGRLTACR